MAIRQLYEYISNRFTPSPVEVFVELHDALQHRGSSATGRVVIVGGEAPCRIDTITLAFVGWSFDGESESSHRLRISDGFDVAPNSRSTLPFRIDIPDRATISRFTSGGKLECRAQLTAGREVTALAHLNVVPHRESFAVVNAFCGLGFNVRSMLREGPTGIETTVFEPMAAYHALVRRAVMEHSVGGKFVRGSIFIVPGAGHPKRRRGLLDYQAQFRIPRHELAPDKGIANPDAAASYLRRALEEALIRPDDPARRLLRAASIEELLQQQLLRPVQGACASDDGSLLLPADR